MVIDIYSNDIIQAFILIYSGIQQCSGFTLQGETNTFDGSPQLN